MKSGVWKHFQKHTVGGVKYGLCLDKDCPSKRKKPRKSEIIWGEWKLIRCTGGNMTNLWYHHEKDHKDLYREEVALRENEKIRRADEERDRLRRGSRQVPVGSYATHNHKAGVKFKKGILVKYNSTRTLRNLL